MNKDKIKEIGIDEFGRLYVSPKKSTFPFIYREAKEVNWDENHKYLYSQKPREWSHFNWYKQVIFAAKEQGCELQITNKTAWVNVPEELKNEIQTWSTQKNA